MKLISKKLPKSLLNLISGIGLSLISLTTNVQAQITSDRTLDNESSKFTPTGFKDLIQGGAIRGQNLFHSFTEFNVNNNQQVYFSNPTGITNILTRITGNNISNISGTLGVEGNANLFLINPHGIIFGKDATLDIKGSFLASTANAIKFADNTVFSAKDTGTNPLLTISVPTGVQWGNNQSGDITNYGNLTTFKDLTLSGRNVNITESVLQTGENLILESQEKVNINDSINKPVILKSAGNITIQGNQSVEINALNNNDSNFTSNRDIIFRSPVRLLSNGNYTVGGYFVTEDLNQNVIDFIIPHNNVIKVNGDVNLEDYDYEGSSLYILASGKITLGNVTINDVDNSQISQVISNGQGGNQTVIINGKNDVGILDIRSGIDEKKLPGILENNPILPEGVNATFENPTNADINTSDIINNGGNVLLTNQYKPDHQLSLGNITVGNIDTSIIFDQKDGGAIALLAKNNISTKYINSFSYSFFGNGSNGGHITLSSQEGNIITEGLNSSVSSDSSDYNLVGNGGKITLSTTKGKISTLFINSSSSSYSSYINNSETGNGGDITLSTTQGDISLSFGIESNSVSKNGGNITINTTNGNISLSEINAYSLFKNGGNIAINTTNGNISTQDINANSSLGNGGDINISTTNGNIYTICLNSDSYSLFTSAGNGGNITVSTTIGNISTRYIHSNAYSDLSTAGNGGAIAIYIDKGDLSAPSLNSFSSANSGKNGNSGDITLKIADGNISIPHINSSATGIEGKGGNITITGNKFNFSNMVINSNGENGSNGGIIQLNSLEIKLTDSDIKSSSIGSGNSGKIDLISLGDIFLNNSQLLTSLEPGSTGIGGNITIQAQNLKLTNFSLIDTGTYSSGNAGNININAQNINLENSSSIRSLTTNTGNAGNIFLDIIGGEISLINNSSISTSATKTASGNSGNIYLNTNTVSLLNGSQIQSLTEGNGTSTAGEIIINANKNIIISGVDPNFSNPDNTALPSENVTTQNTFQIKKIANNDTILTAQKLTSNDFLINNINSPNPNVEYSTRVPYTSIYSKGDDKVHIYELKVNAGTKAVFDIDNTMYQLGYDETTNSYLNTKLTLLDSQGKIIASNDDASHSLGAKGSATDLTLQQDPYLRYTFNQGGTYYLQVSNFNGEGVPIWNNYDMLSYYDLQISLQPNLIKANTTNQGQPSGIFAYTQGAGKAGNINLNTPNLTIENGSLISAFTNGSGQAGNILINSQNLNIKSAEISASTIAEGQAGSMELNVNEINLEQNSKISATTAGGIGGSININAQKLNLNSGGQLLTTTSGNNQAGDINIKVKENIFLSDENTGFFANTSPNSTGNGGNIKIDPIIMNIENGAAIAVNSQGTGIGGNIFLQAGKLILNNGKINAETVNSNGGGITLEIGNYLLLANNSKITSTAGTLQSGGNGGNVQINAPFIIGFATHPNHQIIANAFTGKGGNIEITTNGIFGIQYIDIQASSQSGTQGIIEINTPGIDPTSGLTKLPSVPIDISGLIDNSCRGLLSDKNSFKITGKGGLTPTPWQTLSINNILPDWGFLQKNTPQKSVFIPENNFQKLKINTREEIREIQGFIKDDKGHIILTSQPWEVTAKGVYLPSLQCQQSQQLNP
jgi:filamentous hemagglutinin family protein